ncbi:MAG: hypothetical protein ACYTBP_11835 [Planctomycetota bacterium]|jgi:uncharacterized Zn-finger protein
MKEENRKHDLDCTEDKHKHHLCFLMSEGWHLTHPKAYKEIVKDAEYRCRFCDRTAKSQDNLCNPVKL